MKFYHMLKSLSLNSLQTYNSLKTNDECPSVSLVLSLCLSDGRHLRCAVTVTVSYEILPIFFCFIYVSFTKIQSWSINVFLASLQPANTNIIAAILSFCSLSICLAVSILCSQVFFSPGLLIKHQHQGTHFFFRLLTQIQVSSSHNTNILLHTGRA